MIDDGECQQRANVQLSNINKIRLPKKLRCSIIILTYRGKTTHCKEVEQNNLDSIDDTHALCLFVKQNHVSFVSASKNQTTVD